LKKTNRISLRI